jgi:hypothetical protein
MRTEEAMSANDKRLFAPSLDDTFVAAGWRPGRKVFVLAGVGNYVIFEKARAILVELCGLTVGTYGPGFNRDATVIHFDNVAAAAVRPSVPRSPNGSRLFPLGTFDRGEGVLFMDESGTMFSFRQPLEFEAPSFRDAVSQLLLGIRRCAGCIQNTQDRLAAGKSPEHPDLVD